MLRSGLLFRGHRTLNRRTRISPGSTQFWKFKCVHQCWQRPSRPVRARLLSLARIFLACSAVPQNPVQILALIPLAQGSGLLFALLTRPTEWLQQSRPMCSFIWWVIARLAIAETAVASARAPALPPWPPAPSIPSLAFQASRSTTSISTTTATPPEPPGALRQPCAKTLNPPPSSPPS